MSDPRPPDPVARLEASLEAIKGEGAWLNAVVALDEAGARAAALASQARLAAGQALSSLDGRTVLIKANCAVKGLPWTAALQPLADDIARSDSTVVARLRAAGAIIVGLANMHEAALGATTDSLLYGKAYNPLGQGLTPGGSSGGSAAAVAAGLVDLAVGTDTMGSVRIPSAYCGVVGFKPTRGRVSTDSVIPLSTTLDCVGFHARTVDGVAAMLAACETVGSLPQNHAPADRIAWLETGLPVAPEVAVPLAEVVASQAWPTIIWNHPPLDKVRRAGLLVCERELLDALGDRLGDRSRLSPELAGLLGWAGAQPDSKVGMARARLDEAAAAVDALFGEADCIALPTAGEVAFLHGAPIPPGQADFTVLASVVGLPAITLPVQPAAGLPVGLQLWGRRNADSALLACAAVLQGRLA